MKYAMLFSFFFLLACSSENQKVVGTVFSEDGAVLQNVMVQVMGTDLYTYTDEEGNFAINTKKRGNELIFNLEGFEMERYDIDVKQSMEIYLKPRKASSD